MNQFYETKRILSASVPTHVPQSYESWVELPDDYKAAVLYVDFFDQITMAWYRLRTPAAIEEDCVSEVLLYLQKNVEKIVSDKKRFSPAYIYRISYNCIYCKSVDPYSGQTAKTSWCNNTCSNLVSVGDDVLDLFDTVKGGDDIAESLEGELRDKVFWDKVNDEVDPEVKIFLSEVLDKRRRSKKLSDERREEICEHLREEFESFYKMY